MPLNSVNTNIGAMVALQSLNRTGDEMATTQKRISTGLRVADAKDDGAAFAVAERIRGDISGIRTANEQLGSAQGFLKTTMEALNSASEITGKIKTVLHQPRQRRLEHHRPRHLLEGFRELGQPDWSF